MISAQIDPKGANTPAYGPAPNGLLVFTDDTHFIEVLTDTTRSNVRLQRAWRRHGLRK